MSKRKSVDAVVDLTKPTPPADAEAEPITGPVEGEVVEAAPEPEKPATPADHPMTEVDAEALDELYLARDEVTTAAQGYRWAKEAAKEAKGRLDKAQVKLNCCVDRLHDVKDGPTLFDKPAETDDEGEDDWRDVPLDALCKWAVSEKLIEAFAAAEIHTLGELIDWTGGTGGRPGKLLTDVKGVGEAKAATVEAALEKFWEERKDAAGESESAE